MSINQENRRLRAQVTSLSDTVFSLQQDKTRLQCELAVIKGCNEVVVVPEKVWEAVEKIAPANVLSTPATDNHRSISEKIKTSVLSTPTTYEKFVMPN